MKLYEVNADHYKFETLVKTLQLDSKNLKNLIFLDILITNRIMVKFILINVYLISVHFSHNEWNSSDIVKDFKRQQ